MKLVVIDGPRTHGPTDPETSRPIPMPHTSISSRGSPTWRRFHLASTPIYPATTRIGFGAVTASGLTAGTVRNVLVQTACETYTDFVHSTLELIAGEFQSEFIQIISWNDYGESHYIGPLDNRQYTAFETGKAPYNYVLNKSHEAWRELLPYFITLWKTGTATITREGVVLWYRQHPKSACSSGGTTGNTASQLQVEIAPSAIVQDEIYFAAPLGSAATVSVTVGGVAVPATWNVVPSGGVGIHSGSAPTGGRTGAVVITIARNGVNIIQMNGLAITTTCTNGFNNYNPIVGVQWGPTISARSPPLAVSKMKCIKGFGANGAYTCPPSWSSVCEVLARAVLTPRYLS